jgi:hypothetical protein
MKKPLFSADWVKAVFIHNEVEPVKDYQEAAARGGGRKTISASYMPAVGASHGTSRKPRFGFKKPLVRAMRC